MQYKFCTCSCPTIKAFPASGTSSGVGATAASATRAATQRVRPSSKVTLAPTRNKWIKSFLERIQTRGYSVHFDQMRKIPRAELPKEPRRKHRFVY